MTNPYEGLESPFKIAERVASEHGVKLVSALGQLCFLIFNSHSQHAQFRDGIAESAAEILDEIDEIAETTGRGRKPKSLLEALIFLAEIQVRNPAGNIEVEKQHRALYEALRAIEIGADQHALRHSVRSAERKRSGLSSMPDKFSGLNQLIESSKRDGVSTILIHHPAVLGDTYSELVANMDMLAAAGLSITIVPPTERDKP